MMTPQEIEIDGYNYELDEAKIARYPLEERDICKMLIYNGDNQIYDSIFKSLPEQLPDNAVLIYNSSRVIKARILFRKGEDNKGALIEIFCLDPIEPVDYQQSFASRKKCIWKCIVGNSKKWKPGTYLKKELSINDSKVILKAGRKFLNGNEWAVEFDWDNAGIVFSQIIEAAGVIPIPPYLNRDSEEEDERNYQTVYSHEEGSVAAPTAGLHFTGNTLRNIDERGIPRREVVLHVGAGTFKPVTTQKIGNHEMHREFFSVNKNLIKELLVWCEDTDRRKIIAVGTTTIRTLESLYYVGCLMKQNKWHGVVPQWIPYTDESDKYSLKESLQAILDYDKSEEVVGETSIIIVPGFKFRIVDGLITNFHQPGSTLLLLISAFLGRKDEDWDKWKKIYDHAINHDYRFLSYGDACFFT